jgi:hypothetical protein
MFLYIKFKKNPFSSLITSRFVPKGVFLQKKIRKRMLIIFLYIKFKKNPPLSPLQLPSDLCRKVHSYKKIRKRTLITFLYIKFKKIPFSSSITFRFVLKVMFLQKKIRKKNINNVLIYILNKTPLPLLNYFQIHAKKCILTKC